MPTENITAYDLANEAPEMFAYIMYDLLTEENKEKIVSFKNIMKLTNNTGGGII